ncbi:formate dehydrogenase accessory protein [Caldalkalibacillus thermarum TA2.A1]|uniref:Formate dehydrogenase accessory protein n=1 Tax=Caldalkalibacillus thermarum (strain TA2.A1) TaxID=986075 RepID=F5L7M8_CALTT|nr:formate dehydrogenase accessory protein FdhE [Caldalkalibacillus thermarum]EGL82672.1 formate dehydrogenase accessory protein [Caldalkalibacillus thermarum TA2.A1]QZT33389.1 formate dehydrogenase accessory protein FdhE [Caldalkalibacillus thermarum TA2.A1]
MGQIEAVKKMWQRTLEKNKQYKPVMKVHVELVEMLEMHTPSHLPQLSFTETELAGKLGQGIPFLEGKEKEIDLTSAAPLFVALTKWSGLGKAKSAFKSTVKHLSEQDIRDLLRGWLKGDEAQVTHFASRHQLPIDVLHIVLRYSLLPTLQQYGQQLFDSGLFDEEFWMKPYCPVCGDRQGLAEFRGDERFRHFRCLSCAADWKYWRIGCPYCDNRNHEQLSSWFIQEETGHYQLDVCERCHGYVKGINKIERSSLPFLIFDDFITMSLDLFAQEKGYHPYGTTQQLIQ